MLRYLLALTLVSCSAPAGDGVLFLPATRSPAARASPTLDPRGLARCAASELRAVAAGVRTTDAFVAAVFVANGGSTPCTLRGNPEVVLLAMDGSRLDVILAAATRGDPSLVVVPVSQFQQDPAGMVGMGATAPLDWENYCDDVLPIGFRVTLPDAGGVIEGTFVDITGRPISTFGTPQCDDPAGPSTLLVYPFQEPRR